MKKPQLAAKKARRRRCYECERLADNGKFLDYTDGKRRFLCESCNRRMEIDAAQEQDQDDL